MTHDAAAAAQRLLILVGEEANAVRAFIGLLEKEGQALVAGDVDTLGDLAREKGSAAQKLANMAAMRGALAGTAGAASGSAGMSAWIARQPNAAALRAAWDGLLTLARDAQAKNAENGVLIRTHMAHNQQALGVLLAASEQAALYGRDGRARASAGPRRIDSA